MPLQNRVTPLGEVIADPSRGLVYGNRGCLHDRAGTIRRHHQVRRWIGCRLEFKGRRRTPLVRPGYYTPLFFLDEATAFAAGHRPCTECRRPDYVRFGELWRALHPDDKGAEAIDSRLHAQRWDGAGQRHHTAPYADLPDGTVVLRGGEPWLVVGPRLRRWTPEGYTEVAARPARGAATVVTPPSLVAVLRSGWEAQVPLLHPSAGD